MSARVESNEAALDALVRALDRDAAHVVLASAPGPVTDILLAALAERLGRSADGRRQVVRLAACTASGVALWSRVLERLGETPERDPEAQLLRIAKQLASRRSALVMVLRDAGATPPDTLWRLGRLTEASEGGLRLALALEVDGRPKSEAVARLRDALGVDLQSVELEMPKRARPLPFGEGPTAEISAGRRLFGVSAALTASAATLALLGTVALRPASESPPEAPAVPAPSGIPVDRSMAEATATDVYEVDLDFGSATALDRVLTSGAFRVGADQPPRPSAPAALAAPAKGSEAPALAPESEVAPSPLRIAALSAPRSPAPQASPAAADASPALVDLPVAPAEAPVTAAPVASPKRVPLSLNAKPWAQIEIDGRDVGPTPLANLMVAPGPHRVRARLPDGTVLEREVRVGINGLHVVFP